MSIGTARNFQGWFSYIYIIYWKKKKPQTIPDHASFQDYLHENKTYLKELSSQTDDNEQQKADAFCWKNG